MFKKSKKTLVLALTVGLVSSSFMGINSALAAEIGDSNTAKHVNLVDYQEKAYQKIKNESLNTEEANKVIETEYKEFISDLENSSNKTDEDKEFLNSWNNMTSQEKEKAINSMLNPEENEKVMEAVEKVQPGETIQVSKDTTVAAKIMSVAATSTTPKSRTGTIGIMISHMEIHSYFYCDVVFKYKNKKVVSTTSAVARHSNYNPSLFYSDESATHYVHNDRAHGTAYFNITILNIPGLSKTGVLDGEITYDGFMYSGSYKE